MKVDRALISVFDKRDLDKLVKKLRDLGVTIVSTGGTSVEIKAHEVSVLEVSDLPGSFPEMLGGRVKTLQPTVHAAILAKQDNEAQMEEVLSHKITPVQLVVVNFYPLGEKIQEGITIERVIEEGMDIGGPSMVCSAIKNFPSVAVVVDPNDYGLIITELESTGEISEQLRLKLAVKASYEVAKYHWMVYQWMAKTFGFEINPLPSLPFPDSKL